MNGLPRYGRERLVGGPLLDGRERGINTPLIPLLVLLPFLLHHHQPSKQLDSLLTSQKLFRASFRALASPPTQLHQDVALQLQLLLWQLWLLLLLSVQRKLPSVKFKYPC